MINQASPSPQIFAREKKATTAMYLLFTCPDKRTGVKIELITFCSTDFSNECHTNSGDHWGCYLKLLNYGILLC